MGVISVTLDALHHVAGVAPGHKLLGCVGSSLPQLLRGLAYVVTSTNLFLPPALSKALTHNGGLSLSPLLRADSP